MCSVSFPALRYFPEPAMELLSFCWFVVLLLWGLYEFGFALICGVYVEFATSPMLSTLRHFDEASKLSRVSRGGGRASSCNVGNGVG
jgi:hypothetical protein